MRLFKVSSSMGDDLVIKDPSMHVYGPGVGSSHSFYEIPTMARFNINCDDVWKEFSGAEFVNVLSMNEYDFDSVRRTAELI